MKKTLIILFSLFFFNSSNADISSFVSNLIPGEGITETSIELRDNKDGSGNYQFSILGVRDLLGKQDSNLFTQFSLHTQEIDTDQRIIGNLGLGYRFLNPSKSMLLGANIFLDEDLSESHMRVGYGLEAKAKMLDFSFNQYLKASNQRIVSGTAEQVLSGHEFNISSQVPYMPWSTFNYQGYKWENEKAKNDLKGGIYSLEMALTPSLQFNIDLDRSDIEGTNDEHNYELVFIYPPQENKPNLSEKMISDLAFEEKNMQASLKDKVRRNNNLAVEIQGSVIFTSK